MLIYLLGSLKLFFKLRILKEVHFEYVCDTMCVGAFRWVFITKLDVNVLKHENK